MDKPKLLVIDDEEGVRDAFVLALQREPVEVETAANGMEGIEKAMASTPDLVILDIRMPGMNGIKTLCRLHETFPDLRVNILTAFHEEFMGELQAALEKGCRFELIRKPLDLAQIRNVVHSLLPTGNGSSRT